MSNLSLKQILEKVLNVLSVIHVFYGFICFKVITQGFSLLNFSNTCWVSSLEKSELVSFVHPFLVFPTITVGILMRRSSYGENIHDLVHSSDTFSRCQSCVSINFIDWLG